MPEDDGVDHSKGFEDVSLANSTRGEAILGGPATFVNRSEGVTYCSIQYTGKINFTLDGVGDSHPQVVNGGEFYCWSKQGIPNCGGTLRCYPNTTYHVG